MGIDRNVVSEARDREPMIVALSKDREFAGWIRSLESEGACVARAGSVDELLGILRGAPAAVLLIDQLRPDIDARALVKLLEDAGQSTSALIVVDAAAEGARLQWELMAVSNVWFIDRLAFSESIGPAILALARRSRQLYDLRAALSAAHGRLGAWEIWEQSIGRGLDELFHELRTPLGIVQGFCSNLLDGLEGALLPAQRNALERIRAASELMNELMSRAKKDLARPRLSGELPAMDAHLGKRRPTVLPELAAEILALFHGAARTRGIDLRLDAAADLPVVWADRARLSQLLVNLVSNALRYTREGGSIEIRIRTEVPPGAHAGGGSCRVTVRDTGCGIAPEHQSEIFRAGWSSEGRTGLGLAISKEIADEHSGELTFESAPGDGAAFHLVLPVDARSRRRSLRLKIVEDPTLVGQLFAELTSRLGGPIVPTKVREIEKLTTEVLESTSLLVLAGVIEGSLERALASGPREVADATHPDR